MELDFFYIIITIFIPSTTKSLDVEKSLYPFYIDLNIFIALNTGTSCACHTLAFCYVVLMNTRPTHISGTLTSSKLFYNIEKTLEMYTLKKMVCCFSSVSINISCNPSHYRVSHTMTVTLFCTQARNWIHDWCIRCTCVFCMQVSLCAGVLCVHVCSLYRCVLSAGVFCVQCTCVFCVRVHFVCRCVMCTCVLCTGVFLVQVCSVYRYVLCTCVSVCRFVMCTCVFSVQVCYMYMYVLCTSVFCVQVYSVYRCVLCTGVFYVHVCSVYRCVLSTGEVLPPFGTNRSSRTAS